MNQRRELFSDLLEASKVPGKNLSHHNHQFEDTPADVKRLVTPILHYSITMNVLVGFLEKVFRTCARLPALFEHSG